jgi:hypothetical protein
VTRCTNRAAKPQIFRCAAVWEREQRIVTSALGQSRPSSAAQCPLYSQKRNTELGVGFCARRIVSLRLGDVFERRTIQECASSRMDPLPLPLTDYAGPAEAVSFYEHNADAASLIGKINSRSMRRLIEKKDLLGRIQILGRNPMRFRSRSCCADAQPLLPCNACLF